MINKVLPPLEVNKRCSGLGRVGVAGNFSTTTPITTITISFIDTVSGPPLFINDLTLLIIRKTMLGRCLLLMSCLYNSEELIM